MIYAPALLQCVHHGSGCCTYGCKTFSAHGRPFDGVSCQSSQLGSHSSGETLLRLVSPSHFEGWRSTRVSARPKVFAFAVLPATERERFLQGSNGHLTPSHACSATLCLERSDSFVVSSAAQRVPQITEESLFFFLVA